MRSGEPLSRAIIRDPLEFFSEMASYGDITYFRKGLHENFFLNHPAAIRKVLAVDHRSFARGSGYELARRVVGEGLITSEGDLHRRRRRLAQPAFHRTRMEAYARIMSAFAQRHSETWRDGDVVDLHAEMMRLTLAIVAKTLFDADLRDETGRGVGHALAVFMEMFDGSDAVARFSSKPEFTAAIDYLDTLIYGLIQDRRSGGVDRGDLLSMLIMASDEESGESMTDVQVRDECMTLVITGHESTANLLTWTFWLLGDHPDIEAGLHRELDEVLEGRQPELGDVSNLGYARRILNEALRVRPPIWIVNRRALVDYELQGYSIPEGSSVMMSQWVSHHDPRWFPDPDRFDPERWTPEAEATRPAFAYFPFGGGPHRCIGESFANIEAPLLLATIAQRWKLRLLPGHPVEMFPAITLRPRHGMKMSIQARG